MKNKKGFALIISLVLLVSMALPGTLAVSTDQEAAASDLTIAEITPAPEATETPAPEVTETPVPGTTEIPVPGMTETPAPEATATPAPSETEKPAETEAPCTCGSTDGVHAESCPLYEAPETLMAAPAPVEDTATNTLMIQITASTTNEEPYVDEQPVLVDVTGPNGYSKRVVVQVWPSERRIYLYRCNGLELAIHAGHWRKEHHLGGHRGKQRHIHKYKYPQQHKVAGRRCVLQE